MRRNLSLYEFTCQSCNTECIIDEAKPGRYYCWCDNCDDYAEGFNEDDYAVEVLCARIEAAELRMNEGE
jgi:hypothetical protein